MINPLAQITLLQDYADLPPVDNSIVEDFSGWIVVQGTYIIQDSSHIEFDTVATGLGQQAKVRAGTQDLNISLSNGQTFKVTVIIVSSATIANVSVRPYSNGSALPGRTGSATQVCLAGTHVMEFEFNRSGFEFDSIGFHFSDDQDAVVRNLEVSDISIEGLDSLNYSSFVAGNRFLISWDSDAKEFIVELEENPGATLSTITYGPNLGILNVPEQVTGLINSPEGPGLRSEFQICDGNDLLQFPFNGNAPSFPYISLYRSTNNVACVVGIVCDVNFINNPKITGATNAFSSDGEVELSASGSHGITKYSKYPPTVFQGQYNNILNSDATTGFITGLRAGQYTFYAVDPYNCFAKIDVVIPVLSELNEYGVKYRMSYFDIQAQVESIIEIEERGYNGEVIEVKCGDDPIQLEKPTGELNNKFDCLRPTYAMLTLASEGNLYFIGTFNQDDKKYRLRWIHGSRSWRGYLTPSTYTESWSPSENYLIQLRFTDNLSLLESIDFKDESGNPIYNDRSLLQIISLILKKTDMGFNIVSCINKFAEGMDTTDSDDPFPQTFIECLSFYDVDGVPQKCNEVLGTLLKPFGASIVQENSEWKIIEIDRQTEPYVFRRFDVDGEYIENGTVDPLLLITAPQPTLENILFAKKDHQLEIMPAYGKMTVVEALIPRASLFPRSLDLWQTNMIGAIGVTAKVVDIPNSRFKGMLFDRFEFSTGGNEEAVVEMTSPDFRVITAADAVELSFNWKESYPIPSRLFPAPTRRRPPPLWVRLTWRLKMTIGVDVLYFHELQGWNSNAAYQDNFIYVDEFLGKDDSFSTKIDLPVIVPATEVTLQASFKFEGAHHHDFFNLAGLKAIPTTEISVGTKIKGIITHADWSFVVGSTSLFWYELLETDDAESDHATELPYIVRPTDYDGSTNQVIWKLTPISGSGTTVPISKIQFSDVILRFLPNKENPIESRSYEFVNNKNYNENLSYPIGSGDFPPELINKQLYINIFKLEDGSATKNWTRVDISESLTLQEILLKSIGNQYNKPSWRFAGSYVGPNIDNTSIIKHLIVPQVLAIDNPENPNGSGWSQSGAGQAWTGSSGYCEVHFDASAGGNSLVVKQPQELIPGTRLRVSVHLTRLNTVGDRTDRLVCVIFKELNIVQKIILANGISSNTDIVKSVSFNLDGEGDEIGFMIENISDSDGECDYQMDYFRGNSVSSLRYYFANQLTRNDRGNIYRAELIQLIPTVLSTDVDVDDTGGGNTDGNDNNGGISGRAYSNGFSNGFS